MNESNLLHRKETIISTIFRLNISSTKLTFQYIANDNNFPFFISKRSYFPKNIYIF